MTTLPDDPAEAIKREKLARHRELDTANRNRELAARCQKEKTIALEEGVDVGGGEQLHVRLTLYSSKRGIIRPGEPDYAEKLEQWKRHTQQS